MELTATVDELVEMSRDALNARALELGIEDPGNRETYPNKRTLAEAILAEQSAQDAPERADEGKDTPEAPSAVPERDTGQQRDDLITVVGATAPNTVSLWEQDPRHPSGEVWLVGGQTARVYPTPGVYRALRDRKLERS